MTASQTTLLHQPHVQQSLIAVAIVLAVGIVAAVATQISWRFVTRFAESRGPIARALARRFARPASYAIPLLAVSAVTPALDLPDGPKAAIAHLAGIVSILTVAAAAIAAIGLTADVMASRYKLDAEDNLRAREMETRIDILNRVAVSLVTVLTIAFCAMTFPEVRAVGATLLASAGILGIAAGISARPVLENLLAGVQIALTQPIRLDDVVIVENEYGRIEEITSTYVVVKLWDLRRMVVPLTYFIDKPFQNWTRRTADLLGSVLIYTDYGIPVDVLRAEHERIVKSSPLWDGRVQNVQVVDATEKSLQIRTLVSARTSGELFDLRCLVRERLIAFIVEKYPELLPVEREAPNPESSATSALGARVPRTDPTMRELAGVRG